MNRFARICSEFTASVLVVLVLPVAAQEDFAYKKPPKEILQLVDVDQPPAVVVDGEGKWAAVLARPVFKSLEELAEPELRLAGLRINPCTHNRARTNYVTGIEILEIATGKNVRASGLPSNPRIEWNGFSPRSHYFSFLVVERDGMSLWVAETATGRVRRITPAIVSAALGRPYQWEPDERGIYVHVRPNLDPHSDENALPADPVVQEATGKKAPGRTYQDLLRNQADERKFDHYATTESVGSASMACPRTFSRLESTARCALRPAVPISSSNRYTGRTPTSSRWSDSRIARIADRAGKAVAELADKPLADTIPIAFDSAEAGRRDFQWRDDVPAMVVWIEAQDGGDPARDVPKRDVVFQLAAPFTSEPAMLCAIRNRLQEIAWGDGGIAIVSDFRWKDRNIRKYLVLTRQASSYARLCPGCLCDFVERLFPLAGGSQAGTRSGSPARTQTSSGISYDWAAPIQSSRPRRRADKKWWGMLDPPIPKTVGEKLAAVTRQECGIVWVDFSLRDVLPTE